MTHRGRGFAAPPADRPRRPAQAVLSPSLSRSSSTPDKSAGGPFNRPQCHTEGLLSDRLQQWGRYSSSTNNGALFAGARRRVPALQGDLPDEQAAATVAEVVFHCRFSDVFRQVEITRRASASADTGRNCSPCMSRAERSRLKPGTQPSWTAGACPRQALQDNVAYGYCGLMQCSSPRHRDARCRPAPPVTRPGRSMKQYSRWRPKVCATGSARLPRLRSTR